MVIKKPITATRDPHNRYTTWLHFEGGSRLKFYMRGAIVWPEADQEGFALMAGLHLQDGIIYTFDQFKFWTIDHWLNPDGTIRERDPEDGEGHYLGLIQFIQDCEALYKCSSYFYGGQHIDVVKRHGNNLYRNELLTRRIELIEVPYVSEVGDDLIVEKIKLRRYKGESDSYLANAIKQWLRMRTADVGDNSMVHSLRVLLAGYEYAPWVKI